METGTVVGLAIGSAVLLVIVITVANQQSQQPVITQSGPSQQTAGTQIAAGITQGLFGALANAFSGNSRSDSSQGNKDRDIAAYQASQTGNRSGTSQSADSDRSSSSGTSGGEWWRNFGLTSRDGWGGLPRA